MTRMSTEFGTDEPARARRPATVVCSFALAPATACAPAAVATPTTSPAVLSLDNVRSITRIQEFRALDEPDGDRAAPVAVPDTPELCRAVYDQPVVFGTDWSQFRSVTYSAYTPHPLLPDFASLNQSIAVYPDAVAARNAFDRIVAAAPACSDTTAHYYHRTVQHPDPNTLILNGDMVTDGYRVADTTLIGVSTVVPSELAPIDARELLERLQEARP